MQAAELDFSKLVKVELSNFEKGNKSLVHNKLKKNNMSDLRIFFPVNQLF